MCSRNNCFDCGMFTRNREKGIRLEGKSYFETEFYLRVFLLKLHCNCLPILQLIDDTTNSLLALQNVQIFATDHLFSSATTSEKY